MLGWPRALFGVQDPAEIRRMRDLARRRAWQKIGIVGTLPWVGGLFVVFAAREVMRWGGIPWSAVSALGGIMTLALTLACRWWVLHRIHAEFPAILASEGRCATCGYPQPDPPRPCPECGASLPGS